LKNLKIFWMWLIFRYMCCEHLIPVCGLSFLLFW
jgi:hypothetical protein